MILVGAAVATYALRTVLITVIPAHRLPALLRRTLSHLAPAAFAALVVTALVGRGGLPALVTVGPTHVALLVAGLLAWRIRNLAVPVLAAAAVVIIWEVLA